MSDVKLVNDIELNNIKPIDLIAMARRSLSYLSNNPMPQHDYECRFSLAPLSCSPLTPDESWMTEKVKSEHIDPITVCDTESRNDMAFNMMRMMTGDDITGIEAQTVIHERLISYMKKEGRYNNICWVYPFCMNSATENTWAMLWTT